MSVLSDDLGRKPADRTAKQRRFWHGLAERLDALAAYPTKHAVSEQELRKVDDDIKRCRQLMFKNRGASVTRSWGACRCRTPLAHSNPGSTTRR